MTIYSFQLFPIFNLYHISSFPIRQQFPYVNLILMCYSDWKKYKLIYTCISVCTCYLSTSRSKFVSPTPSKWMRNHNKSNLFIFIWVIANLLRCHLDILTLLKEDYDLQYRKTKSCNSKNYIWHMIMEGYW